MRSLLAIDPLPSHILISRQNGNHQHKKKTVSVSFSPSLCIFVSFLPSKLFCLLSYRVFICFCFVRKAHQKPKWIWKHLHRCPPGATCWCCCCCSQSLSDLKIHLPHRRWQFGWKMEHEAIMRSAVVSRELPTSPDGAEHEWQIEANTSKWFVK